MQDRNDTRPRASPWIATALLLGGLLALGVAPTAAAHTCSGGTDDCGPCPDDGHVHNHAENSKNRCWSNPSDSGLSALLLLD